MTQKTRRTFCVSPCSMSYDAFIQVFCARGDLGAAVLPPWRAAAFSRCASARHGRGLWVRVPLSHAAISFNAFAFENICQQYPTFRAAGFTPPAGLTPQANCGCPPGSVESDPITALVVKGAVGCVPPQLAVKNGLFRAGRVTVLSCLLAGVKFHHNSCHPNRTNLNGIERCLVWRNQAGHWPNYILSPFSKN